MHFLHFTNAFIVVNILTKAINFEFITLVDLF